MQPVGFRFHPNDREIMDHYLASKMNGQDFDHVIAEIDLYRFEPWELPGESIIEDKEEWYFFCRPEYKYKNSKRANRSTKTGYWKPTGKVRSIKGKGTDEEIGTKRTLVFYSKVDGPKAVRTTWVIHQYQFNTVLPHQTEFVLCRLKDKSDDQTDKNSAIDEGEQNQGVVFGAEAHVSPVTIPEEDEELIWESQIDGFELDLSDLSPEEMQAINCFNGSSSRVTCYSSEEEVDPLFVDSLLVEPEELVSEARSTLSNDYRPQRPLSEVYYQGVSDMESRVVHTEVKNNNFAIQCPKGYLIGNKLRKVLEFAMHHYNNDLVSLQDVATSRLYPGDERRMTGFDDKLRINVITRVPPPEKPKEPRKTLEIQCRQMPVDYTRRIQLQAGTSSTKSRNQVEEAVLRSTSVKQGFAVESQKDRKTAKVTGAKQDLKIKSSGSVGGVGKASFIRMEAPPLNDRTGLRSVYAVNILVALAVSIIIVGWFFTEQL